jgi:hypothetical protein
VSPYFRERELRTRRLVEGHENGRNDGYLFHKLGWAVAGAKKGPEKYFIYKFFPTTAKKLFLRIYTFQPILSLRLFYPYNLFSKF